MGVTQGDCPGLLQFTLLSELKTPLRNTYLRRVECSLGSENLKRCGLVQTDLLRGLCANA